MHAEGQEQGESSNSISQSKKRCARARHVHDRMRWSQRVLCYPSSSRGELSVPFLGTFPRYRRVDDTPCAGS